MIGKGIDALGKRISIARSQIDLKSIKKDTFELKQIGNC